MDFKNEFSKLAEKYNLIYQYQDFKIVLEEIGGFIRTVYIMTLDALQFIACLKEVKLIAIFQKSSVMIENNYVKKQ